MTTLSSLLGSTFVGPTGSTGAAGTAATITIGTVTSVGTPTVTNVGTPTNAILDFNLPVGTFTWPTVGIPVSTGSAWNTSLTAPSGDLVGTTASQTLTNKTLTSPTITGGTIDGVTIGYRNIPWSGGADKVAPYTLSTGDIGEFISLGTSGAITVPASTFSAGDVIMLFNNTTGSITITCSAVTTYIGGVNTIKTSVTLATRGICNIFFYSPSVCIITGNVV